MKEKEEKEKEEEICAKWRCAAIQIQRGKGASLTE